MNRRAFLAAVPAGALMLDATLSTEAQTAGGFRLLIGTSGRGSKGVYVSYFSNGNLTAPTLAVEAANPSFIALPRVDFPYLFAVTQPEQLPSHASSFTHPAPTGKPGTDRFESVSHAPGEAIGGCFCGVSHDGRSVFIANYKGASVTTFSASEKGILADASHFAFNASEHGPNPERQQQSYIHSALQSVDGGYVLVNDLGCDRIRIFKFNTANSTITPHGEWHSVPGAGPRHLALHPNGKWIYCINELNSTVAHLAWDPAQGTLTTVGTPTELLPKGVSPDGKRGCELAFSKDLRFLYASVRVQEQFTVLTIDPQTGALSVLQRLVNPGQESRDITLTPDGKYFLSANQFSDDISVFPIDTTTGKLGERISSVPLGGPSCLLFG